MRWFRLYTELIDDPKQSKMDDKTFRIFILLLCLANELDLDGIINLSEKDIAWRLRCSKKQLRSTTDFLKDNSILSNGNNTLEFINWRKRNFKSDDVNARVQRYRKKNETLHETLHETAPDTDTDTDTENNLSALGGAGGVEPEFYLTKKKRKLAGKRLETFKRFWKAFAYPKDRASAADAWMDIPQLTNRLTEKIIESAAMEAKERPSTIAAKRTPIYAQGWISAKRWEDETLPLPQQQTMEDRARRAL